MLTVAQRKVLSQGRPPGDTPPARVPASSLGNIKPTAVQRSLQLHRTIPKTPERPLAIRRDNVLNTSPASIHSSPGREAKRRLAKKATNDSLHAIERMTEDDFVKTFSFGKVIGAGNWASVLEAQERKGGAIKAVKIASRQGPNLHSADLRYRALQDEWRVSGDNTTSRA